MPGAARFLVQLLAALGIGLGGIAAFTRLGDPYGRLAAAWPGVTHHKPAIASSTRLFAAHVLERTRPVTVLLGNSRIMVGLDPRDLPAGDQPGVNAAFGAATAYELRRMVEHALALGPPRRLIIGVDPDCFGGNQLTNPGFSEERLAVSTLGIRQPGRSFHDLPDITWSFSACQATWEVLVGSRTAGAPQYDLATGFGGGNTFWRTNALQAGHRNLARANERTWLSVMACWSEDAGAGARLERDLDHLALALAAARRAGCRVELVLSPVHARHLALLRELGMGPAWERHRRALAACAVAAGLEGVWDFACHPGITDEPFPPEGDGSPMRYFWEASHFSSVLGRRLLARLDGPGSASEFGRIYGNYDGEAGLNRLLGVQERWERENPCDMAELRAAIAEGRRMIRGRRPTISQ